jgi:protein involved in polysaccharide export with SLBB domain
MNFNYRLLLCYILSLFISLHGFSQINSLSGQNLSSVSVDKVTDEEIKAYYLKANENGLSEEDIYRILEEKGLPRGEINKLSERLTKIKPDLNSKEKETDEKIVPDTGKKGRYFNQDANQVPLQSIEKDLSIFGSELFTTNSLVFEPNLRIPTPAGYILGPDDELVVNIFGYSEKTYNVTVNEEGNIYIPQVGPIFVNGLSIEQAASRIRSKLASTIYKAINSGQTTVQITLGKIRSIRITVIGEAKKPGTLTVSSLTTLFNLLYLCGGPSDLGSYRKIELIRGNALKRTIDLYSFLLKGDQKDNVLLREGDVIRIPYYKTRVLLNGNVKRKGKYELIEGETFDQVLEFSGGFSDDAFKSGITVYQLTETERRITDVAKNQFSTYKPLSSDSIVVGKLLNRFENKLAIRGAVMRPGEYELSRGLTLKQLIEKAGGVKEDVYNRRGSISRLNVNNTPIQVSFAIDSILNNQVSIALKKNDEVTIYSIFDLNTPNEISIDGFVNKPGKYKWAENISLNDIILEAGGLTEAADTRNIEIARRIANINVLELNHVQTEILTVDLSDSFNIKDILLKPFDVINIRQRPGFISQRIVYLEGMVVNPGRYTLQMSGDRISDVMKRAGGFRPNADTTAIVIRRPVKKNQPMEDRERIFSKLLKIREDSLNSKESVRKEIFKDYDNISIDLNKALHETQSSENMLLENGDVITIENNTNLVKVSGEVYFPTIIPFKEGENLKYYIEKSGSYTQLARKGGALVIYPDGKAKMVKHFLFFRSYPEIVSRSEIFVPQKSDKNKPRLSLGEWSVVLSSLAIIANVVINLRK